MEESVGAISWFYEGQRNSCVEMIKSFRKHNPTSSIVIISDGFLSDITEVCRTYNCDLSLYTQTHGYPAAKTVDVPLEYLRRFFLNSLHIKERYFINLEPDCLVLDELKVKKEHECDILGYYDPCWSYYLYGNDQVRTDLFYKIFGYYKKCGIGDGGFPHGGFDGYFDRIIGGGGFIFNTNYTKFIVNNWDEYCVHCEQIGKFLIQVIELIPQFSIYQDYLLSLIFPIYNHKFKFDVEYSKKIIHPYKNFYV